MSLTIEVLDERTVGCIGAAGVDHGQCLLSTLSQVLFQALHPPQRASQVRVVAPIWGEQAGIDTTQLSTHSQEEEAEF